MVTGTYGSSTGLSSADCSGNCTQGYFCAAGSTSPTQQPCGGSQLYCPAVRLCIFVVCVELSLTILSRPVMLDRILSFRTAPDVTRGLLVINFASVARHVYNTETTSCFTVCTLTLYPTLCIGAYRAQRSKNRRCQANTAYRCLCPTIFVG